MRFVGHRVDLLARRRRRRQCVSGRPSAEKAGDGAVVMAGAVADAVAAPVEGGERHEQRRGRTDAGACGPGSLRPKPALHQRIAEAPDAEIEHRLAHHRAGRATTPCAASARISGRGSISLRIGQKPETGPSCSAACEGQGVQALDARRHRLRAALARSSGSSASRRASTSLRRACLVPCEGRRGDGHPSKSRVRSHSGRGTIDPGKPTV